MAKQELESPRRCVVFTEKEVEARERESERKDEVSGTDGLPKSQSLSDMCRYSSLLADLLSTHSLACLLACCYRSCVCFYPRDETGRHFFLFASFTVETPIGSLRKLQSRKKSRPVKYEYILEWDPGRQG